MPSHHPADASGQSPHFTVFIPTYNRAHTLDAALESVAAQTFRDFEILIVDDGSTDGTKDLVERWRPTFGERLRYHWQPNQGKHVTYNTAAELARGAFVVLLDSDDRMVPEALQILHDTWHGIPESDRDGFAGVEGLCETSAGALHGTPFPEDVFDGDFLEVRRKYGVTGEKRHSIRTDVLRAHPYPVFEGERHVRPDFTWKWIAHRYRFRHVNRVLQVVDFQADGLTRNARLRRLRNPRGLYAYYRDDLLHHTRHQSRHRRRYAAAQYIRYALRSGCGLAEQWREIPDHALWLRALPRGLQDWLADSLKALRHRKAL